MRFSIQLLGQEILAVNYERAPADSERPVLEAAPGGQFEIGFNNTRNAEAICKQSPSGAPR